MEGVVWEGQWNGYLHIKLVVKSFLWTGVFLDSEKELLVNRFRFLYLFP